jgi:hypothetical protein
MAGITLAVLGLPAKSAMRLRGGSSAYPLVVGTIRSTLAQEGSVVEHATRRSGEGASERAVIVDQRARCVEVVYLLRVDVGGGDLRSVLCHLGAPFVRDRTVCRS